MNQKDRMLAGLPYKACLDGLPEERMANKRKFMSITIASQMNMKNP